MIIANINSITFFYPSKVIGGTEYLFIRLAREFAEKYNLEVFYIDYEDGFAINELKNTNIKHLLFNDEKKTQLPSNTYLITPISNIFNLTKQLILHENTKFLFWFLHLHNVIHRLSLGDKLPSFSIRFLKFIINLFYFKEKNIIKKTLELLHKNNSLAFIESSNYDFNKYIFDLNLDNPIYFPVGLENSDHKKESTELRINNEINIGCLGRLCEEKTYPILHILENIKLLKGVFKGKKIKVHIIGSGEYDHLINTFDSCNYFEIIRHKSLINDELENYLLNNIDILFAMGTSCLEGAKLKIPSVKIDLSYKEIPLSLNIYKWIFNSKGFCVGTDDVFSNSSTNTISFNQILDEVSDKNKKEIISEQCFSYFQKNHSLGILGKAIISNYQRIKNSYQELNELNIFDFNSQKNYLTKVIINKILYK
jgi:hypothetical protein